MGSPDRRNMPYSALPIHGGTVILTPMPGDLAPSMRSAIPLHVDRKVETAQTAPLTSPRLRQKSSLVSLRSPKHETATRIGDAPNTPQARLDGRRNRALEALDKLLEQEAFSLAALEEDSPKYTSSPAPKSNLLPAKPADLMASPVKARAPEPDQCPPAAKLNTRRLRASASTQSLRKPISFEFLHPAAKPSRPELAKPASKDPLRCQPAEPATRPQYPPSASQTVTRSMPDIKETASTAKPMPRRWNMGLYHSETKPAARSAPSSGSAVPKLRISSGNVASDAKRGEIKPPDLHTDRRIQERQQRAVELDVKEPVKLRVSSARLPDNGVINPPFHKFRGSRSMGNLAAAKMSNAPTQPAVAPSGMVHSASSDRIAQRMPLRRKKQPALAAPESTASRRPGPTPLRAGRTASQHSSTSPSKAGFPLDLAPPTFRESGQSTPNTSPSHSRSGSPSNARPSSVRSLSRKLFSALKVSSSRTSARSSRPETPSSHSGLSRSTIEQFSPEDFEEWPEPIDLAPSEDVKRALAAVFRVSHPLIDIDPNLSTEPVGSYEALQYDVNLSEFERNEITEYTRTYFSGSPGIVKPTEDQFRDGDGNYQLVERDHIAYRYRVESQLGVGSFGKVLKCRDYKSGRLVAVKVTAIRKELAGQARVEAQLLGMLKKAGSPDSFHFVRILNSFMFRGHMCIVTEMLGPNLYEVLKRNNYQGLPIPAVQFITKQICQGLEFLDKQGIIHCDLKPENILVSDDVNCFVKIIDFGSGCHEKKRVFTYIQSRFYRAPEILLGVPYSPAIDMWSLGCIVPELIVGRPLFPGEDEKDQVALLCQTLGAPEIPFLMRCSRARHFFDPRGMPLTLRSAKGVSRRPPGSVPLTTFLPPLAASFVKQLLQWSPQRRLSAGGALYHEFLLNV